MDGFEEEETMTTPTRGRMRRQTRPAKYMSKSCQVENVSWSRPGSCSFSFTGEFPDVSDAQPVEVKSRRRSYTSGSSTGSYHAIRRDETHRMPVVNKHGVNIVAAAAMFIAVFVLLFGVVAAQLVERADVMTAINVKQDRINTLTAECASTRSAIAAQSNDMNIRQEAVRLGLISSRGVEVEYLQGPADAVITLKEQSVIQSLASIWEQ